MNIPILPHALHPPRRKGRRKADKDAPSSDGTPGPPYLDPAGAKFPTQFLTPALLPAYVRLPLGLDQDEWLATHSKDVNS